MIESSINVNVLSKQWDGTIKGRMVYNGKPTRELMSKADSASPTPTQESLMLTVTVDAHENRDIMTNDVPNAFVQTELPKPEEG